MIPTNGLAHEHDYIQRVTASEKKCPTIYSGKRGIKFVFVANRVYDVITNANIVPGTAYTTVISIVARTPLDRLNCALT